MWPKKINRGVLREKCKQTKEGRRSLSARKTILCAEMPLPTKGRIGNKEDTNMNRLELDDFFTQGLVLRPGHVEVAA